MVVFFFKMTFWGLFSKVIKGGGGILYHRNCRQKEINNNWQKFGLFEKGPLKKGRRRKVDNICKASVCLKIAGQKEEDDLMFIELIGS